eukprot:c19338_g1_i2.p1 GENE.c19338_g1_i2~~c19338_g1_i2.p1  ORF type:complete len:553 (+),score=69.61 c19338_g1_i2:836-2494(+)
MRTIRFQPGVQLDNLIGTFFLSPLQYVTITAFFPLVRINAIRFEPREVPRLPCSPDGQLSLQTFSNNSAGLILTCLSGNYFSVCDSGWGIEDASVACAKLGFDAASQALVGLSSDIPYNIYGLACAASAPSLLDCPLIRALNMQCSASTLAGVLCGTTVGVSMAINIESTVLFAQESVFQAAVLEVLGLDNDEGFISSVTVSENGFYSGVRIEIVSHVHRKSNSLRGLFVSKLQASLRLALIRNGFSPVPEIGCQQGALVQIGSGIIQICTDGLWATIPPGVLSVNAAYVICRMLGYTNPSEILANLQASSLIAIRSLVCDGSEQNISTCILERSDPFSEVVSSLVSGVVCVSGLTIPLRLQNVAADLFVARMEDFVHAVADVLGIEASRVKLNLEGTSGNDLLVDAQLLSDQPVDTARPLYAALLAADLQSTLEVRGVTSVQSKSKSTGVGPLEISGIVAGIIVVVACLYQLHVHLRGRKRQPKNNTKGKTPVVALPKPEPQLQQQQQPQQLQSQQPQQQPPTTRHVSWAQQEAPSRVVREQGPTPERAQN